MVRRLQVVGALWLLLLWQVLAHAVPCDECFPLEQLEPRLRHQAEQVLLNMLDRESLYTVVGGLKPMSSSFARLGFGTEPLDRDTYQKLVDLRTILRHFRCGDYIYADMMVFRRSEDGKKVAHAFVVNIPALRATIRKYAEFFAGLGITENSHPMETVMAVEHAPPSTRHRGYGYLFGYPKYAVDFFVEAEERHRRTKQFVERDFVHVPTFARETNLFVWAVPKGHTPNVEDLAIRAQAHRILQDYRARRERFVGKDKPGVLQLLREWLCDGNGQCNVQKFTFAIEHTPSNHLSEEQP